MVLNGDQAHALAMHNQARSQHGCPALAWDDSLAKQAQAYAVKLATQIGHLQHSTGNERPGEGENLAWSWSSGGPPKEALSQGTQMWLNEAKNYHGEAIGQGNFESWGHYTQCMWNNTHKVGLGMATDSKGGVYVVGRYSPAGNMSGQKPW